MTAPPDVTLRAVGQEDLPLLGRWRNDAEHVAEQKALEKAGFTREGVLRGAQFRSGRWHDLMQYSRLRHD